MASLWLCLGVLEDSFNNGWPEIIGGKKCLNCFHTKFLLLQIIFFFEGSGTLHIRAPLKIVFFDDGTIFETFTKLYEVPII